MWGPEPRISPNQTNLCLHSYSYQSGWSVFHTVREWSLHALHEPTVRMHSNNSHCQSRYK